MKIKWRIFLLTFASYALIHSVRTAWSSLKYSLNSQPYGFSPVFLGALDMFVLLTLAVSLNTFGPRAVRLGPKAYLQKGLIGLSIIMLVIGVFLIIKITAGFPYAMVYPLVGVISCVGWPTCIYILSLHFEKGIMFSIWNGCIQFGDFAGLLLSFVIVQKLSFNPGALLVFVAILLVGMYVLNRYFLPEVVGSEGHDRASEPSPAQQYNQNFVEEKEGDVPTITNQKMGPILASQQKSEQPVNFLTVWKLPYVTGYILSFVFVKSVNAMISTWLVFYLSMIDMVKQAHIIALLWSVSTFGGGILGAYLNPKFNKKFFVAALFACAVFFVFLQELHLYPNEIEVVVLIISCGIIFGGPFTVMNTSIPLYLSEKPEVNKFPGAKAAIISAMEGYPLLFCGISLLIVPAIGVIDLHWMASLYCVISGGILLWEEFKEQREKQKLSKTLKLKKGLSQPNLRSFRDKNLQWSVNLQQKDVKRKRRSQRNMDVAQNQFARKGVATERKGDLLHEGKQSMNDVQKIIVQRQYSQQKSLLSNSSSQPKSLVMVENEKKIQPQIAIDLQLKQPNHELVGELVIQLAQEKQDELRTEDMYKEMADQNDFQNHA